MPRRLVTEGILRAQGGVPPDHLIVRDHNSPNDPVIGEGEKVDLNEGDVFYSIPKCEVRQKRNKCEATPKRLVVVDDRWEVVIAPEQTGQSIRDLFNLRGDVDLFRDTESPNDMKVEPAESANLNDGSVFITRSASGLKIAVNNQFFTEADGVKNRMTGAEIAKLVFPGANCPTVRKITPDGKVEVLLNQAIDIEPCDEFRVIRRDVNAGFQAIRIERELSLLREGGANVSMIGGPRPAVIYHDVPTEKGGAESSTDVLVLIPSGYPAGIPDNAYLPEGSPLLKSTVGAVQEIAEFDGTRWQKKSLHPYIEPKGVRWDQNSHGFHTYYDEILSWLNG